MLCWGTHTHLCSLNTADTSIITPRVQNPSVPFKAAVRVLRPSAGGPDVVLLLLLPPLPALAPWEGPPLLTDADAAPMVNPVMLTLPPLLRNNAATEKAQGVMSEAPEWFTAGPELSADST